MAAIVDRVDGCVGSLDSDTVSLRQSIPPPDQSNPLLGLPIVAIETILNFLSYDEISLLRSVRRTITKTRGKKANANCTHCFLPKIIHCDHKRIKAYLKLMSEMCAAVFVAIVGVVCYVVTQRCST